MKYWPFKIIKDPNSNKPKIEVEFQNKKQTFFAEEISAKVLVTMKEIAEEFLNRKVKDVVITCPAYFNDLQRKATQMAGKIAGLNVIRIINEPTAAAIAYAYNRKINNDQNILIFDLGGGTFDVSIVNIDGDLYEVKSNCGDMHLGGDDFDNSLVDYCLKELKNKGYDFDNNTKMKTKLKIECEKAKIFLTSLEDTSISLEDIEQEIKISRAEFEEICKDLFNKCIPIIEKVLKNAKLTKEKIADIILLGGCTKIPKIKEIIKNYFKREINDNIINPKESISIGAAIQGAIINNIVNENLKKLTLFDICCGSIGVIRKGVIKFLIPKDSIIPCKKTEKYKTIKYNQDTLVLKIYQSENKIAKENKFLGNWIIYITKTKRRNNN
jgi:L1 cell adhesion molecule like protein